MKQVCLLLIIVMISSFCFSASMTVTFPSTTPAVVPSASSPILSLFNLLHKDLIKSNSDMVEVIQPKPIKSSSKSESGSSASGYVNTYNWKDVQLTKDGYQISFPSVTVGGKSNSLTVSLRGNPVMKSLSQYSDVGVNGSWVNCGEEDSWLWRVLDFGSGALNFPLAVYERSCSYIVEGTNYPVALVSITNKGNSFYDVVIKSPIIPAACAGGTASNNSSSVVDNLLTVNC